MTGLRPYSQSLGDVLPLFESGKSEQLREFTRGIENRPNAVLAFERAFNSLMDESAIDWEGTPDQRAILEMISESHEALETFLVNMPSRQKLGTYLIFRNHGAQATVEFGWLDARAGEVTWDRWTGTVDDPVMAFADIGFMFDRREYRCEPREKAIAEPPLYRYHPERFKAFHACAESVGKIYRHKVDGQSGMLTLDLLNELMNVVIGEMNDKTMHYPRKLTLNAPSASLVMESLQTLATAYGRYVQAGRQIMDFPSALVEMLAKTDVDDIPLDTIKMPFAAQYLHFGPQADLELEPGWLVDGAYVEGRGEAGDLRFTVTAVPTDRSLSRLWFVYPEPEYTQDLVGDYRKMDLATAIDTVLSDRLVGLNESVGKPGGDITEQLQSDMAAVGAEMPDDLRVLDVSPRLAKERLEQVNRRHPVYRSALQLVVNALCYLTAYPDDIMSVWPEGTPLSLKEKADSGRGKEAMRAKSKLAALGYVPVHVCGKRIEEQRNRIGIATLDHGHVASHWRRGHWRNQVHGPGRSLRKLIWVMPVLVGASHRDDEPGAGHLYLVS